MKHCWHIVDTLLTHCWDNGKMLTMVTLMTTSTNSTRLTKLTILKCCCDILTLQNLLFVAIEKSWQTDRETDQVDLRDANSYKNVPYIWIVYIQSMTLFSVIDHGQWHFFKAHLWPHVIDHSQWHMAISLMSITKLSLTGQWHFSDGCSKTVIDQSMTVLDSY